ncbi:MAG: hypothetical protein J7M38_02765 [Armatimonadetes bacterium]|nr:hypothetical protein [Armatimonadota bacterium]
MKRTTTVALTLCIAAMSALTTAACAGEFLEYPEFRYTSALPGGGWGVTPDGTPGFDGALQTNVPVAYTPHQGIILGYSSASMDSTPTIGFSGNDVNGTATIGIGFGSPGRGIYFSEMGTGRRWEGVQNLQWQLLPEDEGHPAFAIGVQDIFSQRDRRLGGRGGGAVSYYAVATQQFALGDRPLYVTLGAGFRRFHGLFGGLSWRATDKLTLMAEYDGWNVNAGAAFDLSDWIVEDLNVFWTMVDLDRSVLGMNFVYASWPDL